MANRIGSLEAGMIADVIVLDRDPFAVPSREVHSIRVRKTFIEGEVVYGSEAVEDSSASGSNNARASTRNGRWLMVVKTVSKDPQRETQFNEWYDKIDVPDVLEVPGYMRARRGVKLGADHDYDQDGKYIAIYNMEGESIDKVIIEMLMATRKMEERGRSTDLLKVVERVYYREYAPSTQYNRSVGGGGHEYLYILRTNSPTLPEMTHIEGVVRATRYELYRVLMTEPKRVPQYLTLIELRADTVEQARSRIQGALGKLQSGGGAPAVEEDAHAYLEISDVRRNAGTQQ
jgi:hypothetical protein